MVFITAGAARRRHQRRPSSDNRVLGAHHRRGRQLEGRRGAGRQEARGRGRPPSSSSNDRLLTVRAVVLNAFDGKSSEGVPITDVKMIVINAGSANIGYNDDLVARQLEAAISRPAAGRSSSAADRPAGLRRRRPRPLRGQRDRRDHPVRHPTPKHRLRPRSTTRWATGAGSPSSSTVGPGRAGTARRPRPTFDHRRPGQAGRTWSPMMGEGRR